MLEPSVNISMIAKGGNLNIYTCAYICVCVCVCLCVCFHVCAYAHMHVCVLVVVFLHYNLLIQLC